MKAAGVTRWCWWIVIAACGTSARLDAQTHAGAHWSLEGTTGGYCIWYLADSATARRLAQSPVVLAAAGGGADLPPALARVIQDEPRFASWIPASICIGFYDRVTADGKAIASGRPGHPVVIATSAIAAQNPLGVDGASNYLLSFMTDDRSVARAAQDVGFDMDGIDITTRSSADAVDPNVAIAVGGTTIGWTGHPTGDASVGKTRSMSFGYAGARTLRWLIRIDRAPATTRFMVGSLEIIGKNSLARALKASPVRAIGPEEAGGTTDITFQPVTKH